MPLSNAAIAILILIGAMFLFISGLTAYSLLRGGATRSRRQGGPSLGNPWKKEDEQLAELSRQVKKLKRK